ncbi:General transcriptional corepressor-like protein [Hapsidospora chrysogenum ATCC 11550]|uniref:General transcriptional corepressor-like protein n=1 Tax=Hapsidospora chrysogenum (strain ATCC 11550 / CBS 779.69 / DSM 880 / IAM 14645 / JCM 23072 / IMI 49137) TaxID=857340 RepID=A0A086TH73_HAPC1|nr:General transcriptional corepressor-like protein [Hapsidospora chrysogenum ATCC 11550]
MASNHHPSPMMQQGMQHPQQAPPPPGAPAHQQAAHYAHHPIAQVNEAVWLQIGSFSELLRVPDEAMHAYERALQANPNSTAAMNAIGMLLKGREAYDKALEFFRAIVQVEPGNGEAWGNLGHCYLMSENLQKAYDAYQQALVNLRDAKDPMLWYGIGILYDRYGSYDYAEEAFSQVMQIQPDFDKANEIYFRLGIIYKQQSKFANSLECFKYIVNSPPAPLSQDDIWFQIGHFDAAKNAYNRVLENTPNHAKVLQQLGWLHHQQSNAYDVQERAIQYLEKSVGADQQDAQSWYLLGRCYMSQQKYPKAYEAYQQAVYRDGRNPTFWCSIGVLYYQINQYRDALDAYSRAIRLNPYISEVWYDLGTLYESCNNQISDALDAYQRAAELDPGNPHIKARLQLLRSGASNGGPPPTAPQPADVHPQAYQAAGPVGPSGWGGSAQQAPANGPNGPQHAPQGGSAGENWAGRLSNVNPPPQPPNPFNERGGESYRGQAGPGPQRQPTPQQDQQMRQGYPEPARGAPPRRGQSPAPGGHQYSQHPPPPPSQVPPAHAPAPEGRVVNPNWGGATPSAAAPPANHTNGVGLGNGVTPFRANHSPRPDGRPPHDNRMPSPKSAYPQHQPVYSHHPEMPPHGAPEHGAPPPPAVPEGPGPRADERPDSTAPKRMREWEEESAAKKQANEENRARLDDVRHRRPSTPPRDRYRRHSSEARRADDHRRAEDPRRPDEPRSASDSYHPSEAAHHQQNHAAGPQNHPPSAFGSAAGTPHEKPHASVTPKQERAVAAEPPAASRQPAPPTEPERAARKMEVDEDYDDSGEDEKKAVLANGSAPESGPGDTKTSPTGTGANGSATATTKAE